MSPAWIVAFALLCALVVVLTLVVLGVLRRCLAVLLQAEAVLKAAPVRGMPAGLAPGARVPDFVVGDGDGGLFGSSDLRGRRSLVLFTGPHCPACRTLMNEMRAARPVELGFQVIAVVEGTPRDEGFAAADWFRTVYVQQGEVSTAFGTRSTPHAFAVDERGVVVDTSIPNTASQLIELAETAWKGGGPSQKPEWLEDHSIVTN